MTGRTMTIAMLMALGWGGAAAAQDVPGIEICTVEKTMERRTSCLQSNVDFLQKSLDKTRLDQQQKIDSANRQIEALKGALVAMQKSIEQVQAAQKKPDPAAAAPAKDSTPPKTDAK
ncbi:hypothetical protein [Rhodopseudomonas pseudopalustris]|uniref:Uncharacterized protein n=1 Tax=Rhodopseudomonas pseudopalustris TaxID=1513892 RepID=A0A1H8QKR3_9BRAD|nr:hypothetical protein [Rhodopseudomonas pseudopalustris]SEO54608.1 hypothetical protein SAMN05444123_103251 [Rhodopseudomonas pseudopalustris]